MRSIRGQDHRPVRRHIAVAGFGLAPTAEALSSRLGQFLLDSGLHLSLTLRPAHLGAHDLLLRIGLKSRLMVTLPAGKPGVGPSWSGATEETATKRPAAHRIGMSSPHITSKAPAVSVPAQDSRPMDCHLGTTEQSRPVKGHQDGRRLSSTTSGPHPVSGPFRLPSGWHPRT